MSWAKPKPYVSVVDTKGPVCDILSLELATLYNALSVTIGGLGRYVSLPN